MDSRVTALEQVFECITQKQNFVLQGGAGSGKTESLKRVIQHVAKNQPNAKIACITHTNLAVDEIKSRLDTDEHYISTIHSFLNFLIKDYKRNIHQIIHKIFIIKSVDEEIYKTYKKAYEKHANMYYKITRESVATVESKRDYDNNSSYYNEELNKKVEVLNQQIKDDIQQKDYKEIKYSDTVFSSFKDLTFGHDDLLKITSFLLEEFPLLSKIIQDKFDYIFIDEYQDTNNEIIDLLLTKVAQSDTSIVGLFGDSMQGIYEDGIGDVNEYIDNQIIIKIEKEDNYRCSEQVINFINNYRDDGLIQKIAFKSSNGVEEQIGDRQGSVKLYYAIYVGDRTDSGIPRNREEYLEFTKIIIQKIRDDNPDYKQLMLTNKSIALDCEFNTLYQVFNDRYRDVKDEIEKELSKLGLLELAELCRAYGKEEYNFVISELKKSGFTISSIADKKTISNILSDMVDSNSSIMEVLAEAQDKNIITKSESYHSFIKRKDTFLSEIELDDDYQTFKQHYENVLNTFTRIRGELVNISKQEFDEKERLYKKEQFYIKLFSDAISFKEVLNYIKYLNEDLDYITMHKTKGSEINKVMVVLENYFWNQYNFTELFSPDREMSDVNLKTQKLFYVACSRAKQDLICVQVIKESETENLLSHFESYEKIELN